MSNIRGSLFIIAPLIVSCTQLDDSFSTFRQNYEKLQPNMLGLWPLSSLFGLKDVSPNGILGVASNPSAMAYTTGPSGVPNTAINAVGITNNRLDFDSPLFSSNSTWTWTLMVKMNKMGTIMGYSSSSNADALKMENSNYFGDRALNHNSLYIANDPNALGAYQPCNFSLTEWQFVAFSYSHAPTPAMYGLCGNWRMDAWRVTSNARALVNVQRFWVRDMFASAAAQSQYACLTGHKKVLTFTELAQVREMCMGVSGELNSLISAISLL